VLAVLVEEQVDGVRRDRCLQNGRWPRPSRQSVERPSDRVSRIRRAGHTTWNGISSVIARLDTFQQRHRFIGFPLAVVFKYFDDQGPFLAALIAYYALIGVFPLLLLGSTILGIVLQGDPAFQRAVIDSAMGQFPVIGEELGQPGRIGGGTSGVVVGLIGCLYGGLGVAQAVQNAMNEAWSVPRNSRPNPFKARGISLLLLATVGLGVIATTAVSAGLTNGVAGDALSRGNLRALVFCATTALNVAIFVVAFRLATARALRTSEVLPGAALAALFYLGLQVFGASYVGWIIDRSSATSGAFAVVLGLIAFVYLTAVAVVLCVEVNVVRVQRLWPRALLTPFTDHVDLTPGDRRAYSGQAKAQRLKGFEEVDVTFGARPRKRDRDKPTT
jgi:membrane protein